MPESWSKTLEGMERQSKSNLLLSFVLGIRSNVQSRKGNVWEVIPCGTAMMALNRIEYR